MGVYEIHFQIARTGGVNDDVGLAAISESTSLGIGESANGVCPNAIDVKLSPLVSATSWLTLNVLYIYRARQQRAQ